MSIIVFPQFSVGSTGMQVPRNIVIGYCRMCNDSMQTRNTAIFEDLMGFRCFPFRGIGPNCIAVKHFH